MQNTSGTDGYPVHNRNLFGNNFQWGVSASALQTEGSILADGKGRSVWDAFVERPRKVFNNHTHQTATDFYNRYKEDIALASSLHIPNFRFSLSWSRIMPAGTGAVNPAAIDFYKRVIDACLENNIEPWITLYHWDLPLALEHKGGWTNREIVNWFGEYVRTCVRAFGDKVKHWMVLNEPMVFTGAGYYLGIHAPGRRGMRNFLPAVHHAVLCQAAGFRIIKEECPGAQAGATFSCSYVSPYTNKIKDILAAKRIDALLNRLFIEPALGLGYPFAALPFLSKIEKYMKPGDEALMKADFDFTGIQTYTREVVRHRLFIPHIRASPVAANKRNVNRTVMNWEVYPEGIYEMIRQFSAYAGVKKIIVTENGAAFTDKVVGGRIRDGERIQYLYDYLGNVLRAKKEGLKVAGYFVWSLTDNFEWAEGYHPRFGLVYVDYATQQRIIKDSGYWYKKLLGG